jgi:hypothetical protein
LRAPLLLALAVAGCGHGEKSDWERKHAGELKPGTEEVVALPPYPQDAQLIEFSAAPTSEFRFFIDGASLGVENGVVRYVLVARSAAGAENVSFEGMRCATGEVRLYALGRERGWVRRMGEWRPIASRNTPGSHNALYRDYFCPQREALASSNLLILALRRGGSSITNSLTEDVPRGASGSGW